MSEEFFKLFKEYRYDLHTVGREMFWWKFSKFVDDDDVKLIISGMQEGNYDVIVVPGKFWAGIQPNHLAVFKAAFLSSSNSLIICAMNSTYSLQKYHGFDDKSIVYSDADRVEIVSYNSLIDFVCLFDEETPLELCKKLWPKYVVKGADWKNKEIPEAKYCEKVIFADVEKEYHTSEKLNKQTNTIQKCQTESTK